MIRADKVQNNIFCSIFFYHDQRKKCHKHSTAEDKIAELKHCESAVSFYVTMIRVNNSTKRMLIHLKNAVPCRVWQQKKDLPLDHSFGAPF